VKKAVNIWSFPADWSLERKLRVAKEAGFAGFEMDLSEGGPVSLRSPKSDLLGIRRQVERAGLQLSGLATGLYWGANAASADRAVRRRAAEIIARQINAAAILGLDVVLVVPGAVGVDFIAGAEVVPYDLAYQRAEQFVRSALPLAVKRKVTICIENVWNKFLLSPLEMRSFLDGFESERVASYLDIGNTLLTGYPEHWVRVLAGRIRRIHVKDFRRNVGTIDGFCDLLAGDVNWPEVMAALRAVHYDGWIAAEMIPPMPFYRHCPETLIHNASRAMDGILALGA
jgi:L-ribulose-5-phosphate 3-epimerase